MSKAKTFFFSKGFLIFLFIIRIINYLYKSLVLPLNIMFFLISVPIYIVMFINIKKIDSLKNTPLALKILTLLFCSFLGGILMLMQKSDGQKTLVVKANSSISTSRKVWIILLHTITILMIWFVPCVRYGRLSWDGLEGSRSTALGSAIAGFASYDSSEASTLLVLLILIHICAILLLIFTCIGKHKAPIVIFAFGTTVSACLLNLIGNSYETFTVTVSNSFWDASAAAYEIDDSSSFTFAFAIVALVISLILILYRSPTASTTEIEAFSITEPMRSPVSTSDPHHTPEERLTQLNDLKARGLITEEEYNEKKQSILSEL